MPGMYLFINNRVRSYFAKMIQLFRLRAYILSGAESWKQGLPQGASSAVAYYLANQDQLSKDQELVSFMQFYAQNLHLSSSQWSQDLFVMYAVNKLHSQTYLEIGGADGYTHSNTYSLQRFLGWTGTLVEPDPLQFKLLKLSRPGNTLINAAISPRDTDESLDLRIVGQLSSLVGHEGDDIHQTHRLNSSEIVKVRAISLSKILTETQYIYFSLDVEGAELSILQSIDWDEILKPQVITVEHNFRLDHKAKLLSLLTGHGYEQRFAEHEWLCQGDLWLTLKTSLLG